MNPSLLAALIMAGVEGAEAEAEERRGEAKSTLSVLCRRAMPPWLAEFKLSTLPEEALRPRSPPGKKTRLSLEGTDLSMKKRWVPKCCQQRYCFRTSGPRLTWTSRWPLRWPPPWPGCASCAGGRRGRAYLCRVLSRGGGDSGGGKYVVQYKRRREEGTLQRKGRLLPLPR